MLSQLRFNRRLYLKAVLRQNVAFFDRLGAGEVINRVSNDIDLIRDGISEKVRFELHRLINSGFHLFLRHCIILFCLRHCIRQGMEICTHPVLYRPHYSGNFRHRWDFDCQIRTAGDK